MKTRPSYRNTPIQVIHHSAVRVLPERIEPASAEDANTFDGAVA
ncbi:hypothetical protein [Rothia dentocariosa]|nr:hypothetical protein [Rothia dentocariosa]